MTFTIAQFTAEGIEVRDFDTDLSAKLAAYSFASWVIASQLAQSGQRGTYTLKHDETTNEITYTPDDPGYPSVIFRYERQL
jgi:hypothetical protein